MLSDVSAEIEHSRSLQFNSYYTDYIMSVQDDMLEREIRQAFSFDLLNIQHLISHICEEMKPHGQ